tara:strand:- start:2689 stop:2940 length:252 start_codon:yes stop_codon:yes gene_type:complete
MKIRVRLFASLKEKAGTSVISLSVPAGTSVEQLLSIIQSENMELNGATQGVLVAINQEYASSDTIIMESDELALIPPVSGGQT